MRDYHDINNVIAAGKYVFRAIVSRFLRAAAIVKAVTNYTDAKMIAELSADLGEAMVGINEQEIALLMAERGK